MNLNDSPEEKEFRDQARSWLNQNAKPKKQSGGNIAGMPSSQKDYMKAAKEWQVKKAEAGYAAVTWAKEYGGMGGTSMQSVIYAQEEAKYQVPVGVFEIGLGMCLPTLMTHGTEEHRQRYVKPALYGEEIWCQLFSEPAAGSDVAGVRSRVKKDGEDWILNGQKVWTSGAHFSDYGIIVARSDPSVPKHKGLSFFFLDMKSPGIEVRPIRQMSGDSNFNEVFFTDVRIPDSQRLGEIGQGWQVAITTLMNERLAVGMGGGKDWRDVLALARDTEIDTGPAIANDHVRAAIANWYVQSQGLKYTRYRTLTELSKGKTPGPENSIIKIVSAKKMQEVGAFGMDMLDMGGVLDEGQNGEFLRQWIGSAGFRIAGGTDEILRNIVAERVLGMPADIRVDKDVAFEDLPSGR